MKTIVVTGGTGMLGAVVVPRLARDYRCIVLSRSATGTDLNDAASVNDAFAKIGEIYALVHLAGGFAAGSVAETPDETWTNMLALNVTGAFYAVRAALPHLTRPGRIVAVSSIAAIEKRAGVAPYVVSKSALNALIEIVAKENRGIAANVVAPDTLTPELSVRVAETIAFLLSDAAANITGAVLPLGGG